MKTLPLPAGLRPARASGVALVVVLSILVLVIGIAVAMLTMATTERRSASVFLNTAGARVIADNAVSIVQAQINQATTGGPTVAWASQPGMVRTYNQDGTLKTAYKLYSATTMTQSEAKKIAPTSEDLPPTDWAKSPALWTDLNAPVSVFDLATSTAASPQYTNAYPIVDSGILTQPVAQRPQGFSIDKDAPGATTTQPAPMPVRWLYVLQNGAIVAPDIASTATKLTFSDAGQKNPVITGRIAFWTDDDSCKVNLNTASGGGALATTSSNGSSGPNSMWDTPHFYTAEDIKFATSQPLSGEFQRYPGHPAMTTLNAVFPQLSYQQILSTITPRYQSVTSGSNADSNQGTHDTYKQNSSVSSGFKSADPILGPLYANANELIFKPSNIERKINPNLTNSVVQKAGFFLTADSRAPEVNLFNLPRIACWPISAGGAGGSKFDNTIAFNSTIGTLPYYFQRQSALDTNPNSPTADTSIPRNQTIFKYLHYLTSQMIPGFASSLASKFGIDNDQVLTEVWDYIRCTNLHDTTANVASFTPASGTDGSGYVAPLETSTGTGNFRGFGRSITLGEVAFIFICTADPIDTANTGTAVKAKGMLESNDPLTNRTLGGTTLSSTTPNSQRRVQMMILPKLFSPSQGDMQMRPKWIRITIDGLSGMTLGGSSLFGSNSAVLKFSDLDFNAGQSRRSLGGEYDYRSLLVAAGKSGIYDPNILDPSGTVYPFISKFVTVKVSNPVRPSAAAGTNNASGIRQPGMMAFNLNGSLTVTIESSADGVNYGNNPQRIEVIPSSGLASSVPIPNLVRTPSLPDSTTNASATPPQYWWAFSNGSPASGSGNGRLSHMTGATGYFRVLNGNSGSSSYTTLPPSATPPASSSVWGSLLREADNVNGTAYYTDVVRSMVPSHGDMRLISALDNVPAGVFTQLGAPSETANPTSASDPWSSSDPRNALLHQLMIGSSQTNAVPGSPQDRRHFIFPNPVVYASSSAGVYGLGGYSPPMFRNDDPAANTTTAAVLAAVAKSGDFDTGTVYWPDGAYINKPDEGNVYSDASLGYLPYFTSEDKEYLDSKNFFSPNRMIPGPGMFGSLPTHVKRYASDAGHPEKYAWRTLLFRNQPTHPNAVTLTPGGLPIGGTAPDHLLMDLFWMPAVEPYAISEPFSTAGKVNMNYQIQPFTYISRQTGMYAALDREKVVAVPTADYPIYKTNSGSTPSTNMKSPPNTSLVYRTSIDPVETLKQFETRFSDASARIFLSPTELCDQWLVPQGQSLDTMTTFWKDRALTGDNMRERPYTTIIPRLTTKSNTYTVHYRVQMLKSPPSVSQGNWEETKGLVINEYRGSTTIQRFVDSNDSALQGTDFAFNSTPTRTMDDFVRWRVVNTRQFAP